MVRIGFIPSHRSPFNKEWAVSMRDRVIKSIERDIKEVELIYPDKKLTDGGLVTFKEDADKVIKLFKEKDIQGLIIGMMTFLAWHCGNAPISLKCKTCRPQINTHSILGRQIGYDKSYGTAEFQLKEGLVTINRLVEVGGCIMIVRRMCKISQT